MNEKDRCGCNFLHLAILQPKGLKNLSEEILQVATNQHSHYALNPRLWCDDKPALRLILSRDHSKMWLAWELSTTHKLASTLLTASQSDNIVNFTQPHTSFCIVCVCPRCLQPFSTTAWRSCWPGRTMRAAPRSTTPADWASTTRWRTCWVSPGRTAWHASPRTRSQHCTLPLSKSSRWPPQD